jgi:hypothetical protein
VSFSAAGLTAWSFIFVVVVVVVVVVVCLGGGATLLLCGSNEQRIVHIMYIHFVGMSQTFPQGYKQFG